MAVYIKAESQNVLRRILVELPELVLWVLLVTAIYYAYFVQPINTLPAYTWLTGHWRTTSHYSHGPLIPLIAAWLLWWKRDQLRRVVIRPCSWGMAVVVVAMGLYYVGVKGVQERVVVISFVCLLYGLALALGGRELFALTFFPISFLFLMVPLNFFESHVGVPLRLLMARSSTVVLNWLGIETVQVGTAIYSKVFQFDVANPCSGIQSLMALTTVTAAYAYVTQQAQWKRWVLFLSAIPLAVLGNMARVISIALVAQTWGQEVALRMYHDYSGYIVFAVALSLMVFVGWLLHQPFGQIWKRWTQPVVPRKDL